MEMSVQRKGLARLENICHIVILFSRTGYGDGGRFTAVWHGVC